jgi:nitrogen fixation/metabolism regulation signal transduction histidine kinase
MNSETRAKTARAAEERGAGEPLPIASPAAPLTPAPTKGAIVVASRGEAVASERGGVAASTGSVAASNPAPALVGTQGAEESNSRGRSGQARAVERREPLSHERRVLLLTMLSGLPAVVISLVMLWTGDYTPKVVWTLTTLVVCCWFGFSFAAQSRVIRPLQTVSNLLAALREGDYSVRARGGQRDDALSEVIREVNALSETLREQRLGALEASALLRTVMGEIDVAVFAFDPWGRLRLANRTAERLLARPMERITGRDAEELGLSECLRVADDGTQHTFTRAFPGDGGTVRRWGVRRSSFRERGVPHQLLVLTDLSQPLREEELKAWQRIVRVLGHELNNSLAPIKSIAGSLASLLAREPRPSDWEEDARSGLGVIAARAEALNRFMNSYARLARLPPPVLAMVDLGALVRRVAGLETRLRVETEGPEGVLVRADADQLEQLLINLIRNAVDASLVTNGRVRVRWRREGEHAVVTVEDEGQGIANSSNLFVPFFTTKPNGSGIGLVLCRQIAEAHGGTLALENRADQTGCVALLRLPR